MAFDFLNSQQTGMQNVTSTIDPDLKQAYLNQINYANTVADRPYQQYQGPQVAGFTQDQQNAFQGVRNMQGQYQPYLQGAANTTQGVMGAQAGNFLTGNIGAYMNPYTQQVINTTMSDIDRARQMQQQQVNAQALSRGAFGGSRQAVAEAENNRNFMDQQARTIAGLRQQGFDTAAGLMQRDFDREQQQQQLRLGAANQFANIGSLGQQLGLNQAQALGQVGGLQQQQQQRNLDVAKADFERQWNYPVQQLAIRQSALPAPNAFGSTQSTPIFENNAATLAGLVGTGAGVAKNLGITGSQIGGALNTGFNFLSGLFGGGPSNFYNTGVPGYSDIFYGNSDRPFD